MGSNNTLGPCTDIIRKKNEAVTEVMLVIYIGELIINIVIFSYGEIGRNPRIRYNLTK